MNQGLFIGMELEMLAENDRLKKDFPRLAKFLAHLGDVLGEVEQDVMPHIDGDEKIPNPKAFEQGAILKLEEAARHKFEWPDGWPDDKKRTPTSASCEMCGLAFDKHVQVP